MSNSDGKNPKQVFSSTASTLVPAVSSDAAFRAQIELAPLAPFRMLLVSFLAAAIGLVAGVVAFALYKLIGLFTNLFFFHRWSADFSSAQTSVDFCTTGFGDLGRNIYRGPFQQNWDFSSSSISKSASAKTSALPPISSTSGITPTSPTHSSPITSNICSGPPAPRPVPTPSAKSSTLPEPRA